MLYREMPKNNDRLSILGFGCMRFAGKPSNPDEESAIRLIRHAIDSGVNYFDTAWPYHAGKSEVILGKALQGGYRKKVKIADKLPQWLCKSREDMDHYLNTQLERLGTNVIDYYLIHAIDGGAWRKAKTNGVVEFMNAAKAAGKIVNAGFSFHGPREDFMDILDDYDWDFCQIQFNILDEHYQAGRAGLEAAWKRNIGVIIMEPLRGGSLAGNLPEEIEKIYHDAIPGRSNAEWSLRWIWNHPGVICVLSGMNTIEQVDENIKTAATAEPNSMSDDELSTVQRTAEIFRNLMKVPCTGCQYCMPCPYGVDIPSAFSFYNRKYLFKKGFRARCIYLLHLGNNMRDKPALASRCVNCGACVSHCPQHIDIPAELNNVKKEFEGPLAIPLRMLLSFVMSRGRRKK